MYSFFDFKRVRCSCGAMLTYVRSCPSGFSVADGISNRLLPC